jgi:hypothetical protein
MRITVVRVAPCARLRWPPARRARLASACAPTQRTRAAERAWIRARMRTTVARVALSARRRWARERPAKWGCASVLVRRTHAAGRAWIRARIRTTAVRIARSARPRWAPERLANQECANALPVLPSGVVVNASTSRTTLTTAAPPAPSARRRPVRVRFAALEYASALVPHRLATGLARTHPATRKTVVDAGPRAYSVIAARTPYAPQITNGADGFLHLIPRHRVSTWRPLRQ